MLLDISQILKNQGSRLDFEHNISLGEFEELRIKFKDPVLVNGCVKNTGGVVVLEANVKGRYETMCDRCGEDVSSDIEFNILENYVKDEDFVNVDDAIILESDNIDLQEVVLENAFAAIPLKHLCKEDCKGVCPICGTNLNHSQCDCEKDVWNPQFEALKGLFD